MKLISSYLERKKINAVKEIDQKTVFHLFDIVIREEYGRVGGVNIRARFFKDGNIFVDIRGSNWANELWMNKSIVISKINKKIGNNEIKDIKV